MIIRTASFKNLHGHLNPSLRFRPGINILIGVNGSGKTSVLNAIAWTLSPAAVQGGLPAAYLLSSLQFDEINVAYSVPGQRSYRRVKATRSENSVTIRLNEETDELVIPALDGPEPIGLTGSRGFSERADAVSRYLDSQRENPVLRELNTLSGPLYMPLNRRWFEESEGRHRIGGPYFRHSLAANDLPILEVLELAERVYGREQSKTLGLSNQLRDSILTALFEFQGIHFPSPVWTMEELQERRLRMRNALEELRLTDALKLSEDYFERLSPLVAELGGQSRPDNFPDAENSEKWFEWMIDAGAIAVRIEELIPLIRKYEADRVKITQRSAAFLNSVNGFLGDSGKKVDFRPGSGLEVTLPNDEQISIHQLSSGELQLLVLFAFLYFQFDPDQEFVVFVDEPELSLHIAWQNRYVSSIKAANPKAQFIIATHSPEIAGPARDAVIDISPRVATHA